MSRSRRGQRWEEPDGQAADDVEGQKYKVEIGKILLGPLEGPKDNQTQNREIHFKNGYPEKTHLSKSFWNFYRNIKEKGAHALIKQNRAGEDIVCGFFIPESISDQMYRGFLTVLRDEGICDTSAESQEDDSVDEKEEDVENDPDVSRITEEVRAMHERAMEEINKKIDTLLQEAKAREQQLQAALAAKTASEQKIQADLAAAEANAQKLETDLKAKEAELAAKTVSEQKIQTDLAAAQARAQSLENALTVKETDNQQLLGNLTAAIEHIEKLKNVLKSSVRIATDQPLDPRLIAKFQVDLDNHELQHPGVIREVLLREGKITIKDGQTLRLPPGERFGVNCEIVVESEGRLIIEPGTEMHFGEAGGIFCEGTFIATGTATEKILFTGYDDEKGWKNITIDGGKDSNLEHCIIQGGRGRAYTLGNGHASIDEHGKNMFGGGIAFVNDCQNVTMNAVEIRDCKVNGNGGGIYFFHSSPKLETVILENNEAVMGGGYFAEGGKPEIISSAIENNVATVNGGAFFTTGSEMIMKSSLISHNRAQSGGGGYVLTNGNSTPTFHETVWENNEAEKQGGGIYLGLGYDRVSGQEYSPEMKDLSFIKNQACKRVTISGKEQVTPGEGGDVFVYHNMNRSTHNYMLKQGTGLQPFSTTEIAKTNTSGDIKEVFASK